MSEITYFAVRGNESEDGIDFDSQSISVFFRLLSGHASITFANDLYL
jgi:hypothetical protein